MNTTKKLTYLATLVSALLLTGCGDAETEINELPSVVEDSDDAHDHGEEEHVENAGRLSVLDAASNTLAIYNLEDNSLLDTFTTTYEGSSLTSSAGSRFAVITSRSNDLVEFVDGGLWQEDHGDHLHAYEEAPTASAFTLSGSRPTHVDSHDGQLAVFFDGDADSGLPAMVQVVTDSNIANESAEIATLDFTVNMHGVAKPVGDMLLASVRREDSVTTSANAVLPDSVGVYHLHDSEYEQEQLFEGECPDLHGAAVTDDFAVFGCSDGVLVLAAENEVYTSSKIENIDAVGDLRVGSVYTHHDAASFIGVASAHGGGAAVLVAIDTDHGEMEEIDWEPQTDASPISYGFSYDGAHFLILDSQGYLSVMAAHTHDDHVHWELENRIDISEQDIASMPDDVNFSMAVSQSANAVYVADPIASHIVIIDIEAAEITSEVELDFVPVSLGWLGIAEAH